MFNKIKLFFNYNPFYIPALLLFVSSLISLSEDNRFISFIITSILSFFLITFLLYLPLYYWRHIAMSFSSFIFFSLNIFQFIFYLVSFNFMLNEVNNVDIYLKDLSLLSQYRYLCFCIISFFLIVIYLFSFIFKINIDKYIRVVSFPYLHEEIHEILNSWKNAKFGKLISRYITNLLESAAYRYFFFCLEVLSFLFRFAITILLISFCFFEGNLSYILYLLPLSFLFWLLSFIIYHINWVIEGNATVIKEYLELSPYYSDTVPLGKTAYDFKLTSAALNEGFTEYHLPFLINKWLLFGQLTVFFQYRRYLKYLSGCIIFGYIICWCYITYYFFYASIPITHAGWIIIGRRSLIWKPNVLRCPRDARNIHEGLQNPTKVSSGFQFAIGHPVYGELLPDGTYRIDGFLTRSPIYGINISHSPLVAGKTGGQNAVAFSTPIIVPGHYVTPALAGSTALLEAPGVKAVLDHLSKK